MLSKDEKGTKLRTLMETRVADFASLEAEMRRLTKLVEDNNMKLMELREENKALINELKRELEPPQESN